MSFDAETAGNAEEIEMQFAVKTVEHLEAGPTGLLDGSSELTILGIREVAQRHSSLQN